jgi:hypothetical protein
MSPGAYSQKLETMFVRGGVLSAKTNPIAQQI